LDLRDPPCWRGWSVQPREGEGRSPDLAYPGGWLPIHRDTEENAMHEFIAKHRDQIRGVLSGFDRLVFRDTLRAMRYAEGRKAYLIRKGVWVGDFAQHVQAVSERLKQSSLAEARKLGRTVLYLASSQIDKDAVAREIAARQKITGGPVCVLTC